MVKLVLLWMVVWGSYEMFIQFTAAHCCGQELNRYSQARTTLDCAYAEC